MMLKHPKWSLRFIVGSGLAAALIAPTVVRAQAPQTKEDEQKQKDTKQPPRNEGERPKSGPPSAPPQQKMEAPPAVEKKAAPPPPASVPKQVAPLVLPPKEVPPAVEKKAAPPPPASVPKQVAPLVLPPKEAPPAAEKKAAPPPPVSVPKQVAPPVLPPKEATPTDEKKAAPPPPAKTTAPLANPPPVVTQPAVPKQVTPQVPPPLVVQPSAGSVAPPPPAQPVLPPPSGQPSTPPLKQLTPVLPVQPGTSPLPPKAVEGTKEVSPPTAKSVQPAPVLTQPAPAPTPTQGATTPGQLAPSQTAQPKVGAPVVNPVVAVPVAGPKTIDQVRQGRVESIGEKGQTIIKEPGDRTIIKQDNRVFITRNETTVIQNLAPNAQTTVVAGGISQTVFQRPDGARVFSEVDGNGRLLRRYRRDAQDREIVFVDNRKFYRNLAVGVGIGIGIGVIALALAPPVVALPRTKYIVDYDRASDDDLYEALSAPPVVRLERNYSLDEIRYSEPLRARVRRVDLDTITFEFGSFEVSPQQHARLERVARAIGRAIERNPAEVFMIEGHTDAVGADIDNLSLSDRRAESVARILMQYFSIPIENLVTQGYGEQFLKVPVQTAERANRRVAVRRITDLLSQEGPK